MMNVFEQLFPQSCTDSQLWHDGTYTPTLCNLCFMFLDDSTASAVFALLKGIFVLFCRVVSFSEMSFVRWC